MRKVLATTFAALAALTTAPAAQAAPKLEVGVKITNKGAYTAHLCGLDWLGGYCHSGIRTGETTEFTVYPRSRTDLVWARVVISWKGSDETTTEADQDKICFTSAGTASNPTIERTDCA